MDYGGTETPSARQSLADNRTHYRENFFHAFYAVSGGRVYGRDFRRYFLGVDSKRIDPRRTGQRG